DQGERAPTRRSALRSWPEKHARIAPRTGCLPPRLGADPLTASQEPTGQSDQPAETLDGEPGQVQDRLPKSDTAARRIGQNGSTQTDMIASQSADLRLQWGERGDSNPRHPGPQLSDQTDEAPAPGRSRTSEALKLPRSRCLTVSGAVGERDRPFTAEPGPHL